MSKAIRVLFTSHLGDLRGGADRSLLTLMQGIRSKGIEPIVLVPTHEPGTLADELEALKIRTVSYRYRTWISPGDNWLRRKIRWIANLIVARLIAQRLANNIDLVYSNTLYTPIGALIARNLKVPHIWHAREFIHEMGLKYDLGTTSSMSFVNSNSALIVCVSKALRDRLARWIAEDKLTVIYNGFSEVQVARPSRSGFVNIGPRHLCIVGLIVPEKGQHEAIEAVAELSRRGYDIQLHIAGNARSEYLDSLKELAAQHCVADNIRWYPFTDPQPIYRAADLNLICSRSEGSPRVLIEAMAVGLPTIASCVGGIPELIDDGATGLLYEAGNLQELVEKIITLLENEELYRQISAQGQSFASRTFRVENYLNNVRDAITLTVNSMRC